MAENTEISWTDSTFNPWWGCQRISPGCDNCYAAALDKRTGGNYWNKGEKPRTLTDNNWRKPHRWNQKAQLSNQRRKMFCGSMCDVFDKNAPAGQRERLWETIRTTPMLDWQLLTKRPTNIRKYLPGDWNEGYDNAWVGVTVEDIKHGIPRIDVLRRIPAKIRFLSIEPLLEDLGEIDLSGIQWVIIGGESGRGFRRMEKTWANNIIRQCREQGTAVFFKQWGGISPNAGGCFIDGIEIKEWPTLL